MKIYLLLLTVLFLFPMKVFSSSNNIEKHLEISYFHVDGKSNRYYKDTSGIATTLKYSFNEFKFSKWIYFNLGYERFGIDNFYFNRYEYGVGVQHTFNKLISVFSHVNKIRLRVNSKYTDTPSIYESDVTSYKQKYSAGILGHYKRFSYELSLNHSYYETFTESSDYDLNMKAYINIYKSYSIGAELKADEVANFYKLNARYTID